MKKEEYINKLLRSKRIKSQFPEEIHKCHISH